MRGDRPTSVRLNGRILGALDRTATMMGVKRSVLLRECVRVGLAEVLKREYLIAQVGSSDYNLTPIGDQNVSDVDYKALGGKPHG